MQDIVDCGFHAFNPIQPNAMDIEVVKKEWGDKLCLIGNLNLDSTLTLGTPEDVRAEVYERIRTIGPGGGYMVASSNSVTDYVPLANMRAMFDATFEFGKYPIQLEQGGVKGKVWKYQAQEQQQSEVEQSALDVGAYTEALLKSDVPQTIGLFQKDLDNGSMPQDIINKG